ncbi:MAG: bifunctional folylpolyglutamate synthase/dihydrofolate synthase [Bacteroidales bacterium]|nr:bifunctional folylpolyglutamate synthase/dihydrofolate synthase [Bacteroidales bacterium]
MFDIDSYSREIENLFNQFPSYQRVGKEAYKPGLESMLRFDNALGNPHKKFMSIHVAGTNGKGSVAHMIAAVLQKTGAKIGLYTSPHLTDFRERIRINGEMVSREFVYDFLLKWKPFMEENKPSFFEITTAMAFDYFAKEGVDIAVIETGLGGRLDSTNIITPILSVITNIALDHCEQLGNTLGEIAREKAGIIKYNVPVIVGEVLYSTRPVFVRKAKEMESKIIFAQEDKYKDVKIADYNLDLKGEYQNVNIRTVLTALYQLSINDKFQNLIHNNWSDALIREALQNVAVSTGLRGRWEYLISNPPVLCDTGHNANGLEFVFAQLRSLKPKRLFIILGFVADKKLDAIMGMMPHNAYYFLTQAKIPRALDANILAERVFKLGIKGEVKPSVEEAINSFKKVQKEGDLLFIGGSNFIVAEAINFFENKPDFFAE